MKSSAILPGKDSSQWKGGLDNYVPEPNTGCWLWLGHLHRVTGYGSIKRDRHTVLVHRAMYERERGPIPPGLTIDHLCRVRSCVNPAHMEPVTRRINTLRGDTAPARNVKKTHCSNGHPFSPENTYLTPGGKRHCRACHRAPYRNYAPHP